MAILDATLEFSDAQALTSISSGSSSVSTNVADLGADGKDGWGSAQKTNPGAGGNVYLNVEVQVAMSGASAALDVQLVTKAANASISAAGTLLASVRLPAVSAAGTSRSIAVPAGCDIERYLGVLYTASGAQLTSATINAWLGTHPVN